MEAITKQFVYDETIERIKEYCDGETDPIAILSTVVCELHHNFEYFDWTGFYRVSQPGWLSVGPYQGTHGCLRIPFDRGICGAAARTRQIQLVPDVALRPEHIACSAKTKSELVVPVLSNTQEILAVLDVDSNQPNAFDEIDRDNLERLCRWIGERIGAG